MLIFLTSPINLIQEPGGPAEIKQFVNEKYQFKPDLYDKIDVNGTNTHPIYQYLKQQQGGFAYDDVKWNFTKVSGIL